MPEENLSPDEKLRNDIRRFVAAYNNLLPEAKATFEAQLNGIIKNMDERTKKLYATLLSGTKDGLDMEAMIKKMEEVDRER